MATVEANCRLVAEREGLTNFTIEMKRGSEKGDNFLGEITMVTVSERHASPKRLNLIAKRAIQNPLVREKYPIAETYENEIFVYNELKPILDELQNGIDDDKKFSGLAKCYYTSLVAPEEMLILENLQSLGYQMHDKTVLLDGQQMEKIFETYGRFHGLAFALKGNHPDKYKEVSGALQNIYVKFDRDGIFSKSLRAMFEYFYDRLVDDRALEAARKYSVEGAEIFKQLLLEEEEEDFFCILHGDCWSNNILFKYEGRTLEKICLIDWQLARVGSPACDLSYAMYSGASKPVLDDYEKYLKIYHRSLSLMLTELKCDVEKMYPYNVLKEHWKKYAKLGALMGIMVLRIKYTKKEDIFDHTDVKRGDCEEMQEALDKMTFDDSKLVPAVRDILNHLTNTECI